MMFINEVIATMTAGQTLISALLVLGVVSFSEMQVLSTSETGWVTIWGVKSVKKE